MTRTKGTGWDIAYPVQAIDIELSRPIPTLLGEVPGTGQRYRRALLLARLHSYPLGVLDLQMDADVPAATLAEALWQRFHGAINEHLCRDGLPEVATLDERGLAATAVPACLEKRSRFLEAAPMASIVVATRDRPDSLAKCLPSLLAQEYPHYEVIVVNNAPRTSTTADLIRDRYAACDRVRYVREDRPGLSRARNCGLQAARGEIVAIADDDEPADAHWLAELAMAFGAADSVACVTGLTQPAELETEAQVVFEEFGGYCKGREFTQRVYDMTTHRLDHPLYPYLASFFGTGGNLACRASALPRHRGV